jgi:hypothetical protein
VQRFEAAIAEPLLKPEPCRSEFSDGSLLKQSKANLSVPQCGRVVDVVSDLSVNVERIDSVLGTGGEETVLLDVEPLLESLIIFGLDAAEAVRHRDIFARVLAESLPQVSKQDIRILRISDSYQHGSASSWQKSKDRRKLRSIGRRAHRSGVQIDFEVVSTSNTTTSNAMEHVEAWLLLLREAGPACQRFGGRLEMALAEEGAAVSLPDGEKLHAEFGTPRYAPLGSSAEAVRNKSRSPRSLSQKDDHGDVVLAVFLGFVVVFGLSFVIISMVLSTTSYY